MSTKSRSETHATRSMLSLEQGLELLLSRARCVEETESLPTMDGLGRVLAQPLCSAIDVPGWDNSAMDGYALRYDDVGPSHGRLRVAQRIPAGIAGEPLAPGTAARIFTGAPVPEGADTVVPQEDCEREGELVRLPIEVRPGANIRRAGEDIAAGAQVIAAGTRLAPQHLGLAASVGAAQLEVYRPVRVAVLASGDELVMPGNPLGPGQIYNSNRFVLRGLLEAMGCQVVDLGIVEDTLDATLEALAAAAESADLVVASGGVSVGEEDHVKPAVERLGTLDLWSLAIRPGKPVAFGHIGEHRTPFIGNPGNPVSLFVTFCLFARPFIQRMQGIAGDILPRSVRVRAGFDSGRPNKRREFQRARIATGADGEPEVIVHPSRSSAVLSSVAWATGLVVIPEDRVIRRGDLVDFIPMTELTT